MSDFTDAVDRYLDGIDGVSPGCAADCPKCPDFDPDDDEARQVAEEPVFSWFPCDSCGSTFAGDRHPAHGFIAHQDGRPGLGDPIHLEICTDCLVLHANGDEPEEWQQHPTHN